MTIEEVKGRKEAIQQEVCPEALGFTDTVFPNQHGYWTEMST